VLLLSPGSWLLQICGRRFAHPLYGKIAKTSGVDSWDQIEAVGYTWNLQFGALHVWGSFSFFTKEKETASLQRVGGQEL
jgi:hypothetical protein